MEAIARDLFSDQALRALVGTACLLALADLITGVAAAIRTRTFEPGYVAAFILNHAIGRVLPVVLVGALGHFEPLLWTVALAAAGVYTVETLGSVRLKLMLPPEDGT